MTQLISAPLLPRRTFLLGCLLPMLTTLAACHKPHGLVKICRHPWPGYMLLDLARAQGWLPEDEFRLINLGSAKGTLRALIGNSVDVACLTLDEVLRARANGFMLQVIGVINFSRGADVVIARRNLNLHNLAGHRLAFENGTVGQVMLEQLLGAAKINRSELQLVEVGSEEHINRFKNQEFDALITFEPIASQLLVDPNLQIIYSSRDCPNLIVDVFACTPHAITAHQEQIATLLAAHYQAQGLIQTGAANHRIQLAELLKVSPGQLQSILQGLELCDLQSSLDWLGGSSPPLLQSAQQLTRILQLSPAINDQQQSGLIATQFIQALQ